MKNYGSKAVNKRAEVIKYEPTVQEPKISMFWCHFWSMLLVCISFCVCVFVMMYFRTNNSDEQITFLQVAIGVISGWFCFRFVRLIYFHSNSFLSVKRLVLDYIEDCNDLNKYIQSLKDIELDTRPQDYGKSELRDTSLWNYSRPYLKQLKRQKNVYFCSRDICSNSKLKPFYYLCKYFEFPKDEDTLVFFETLLNDFSAVEDGKKCLVDRRSVVLSKVSKYVPFMITSNKKLLMQRLEFDDVDLSTSYFPKFTFKYVSSGGKASLENTIVLDIANLNGLIEYINGCIKRRQSMQAQRALMTSTLRKNILVRDNYTCQKCGISIYDEPHLLLEVDHIIPISKGGLTRADNLQTLCWKCNRSKSAKLC